MAKNLTLQLHRAREAEERREARDRAAAAEEIRLARRGKHAAAAEEEEEEEDPGKLYLISDEEVRGLAWGYAHGS